MNVVKTMRLRNLRYLTAVLLAIGATLFTVGTQAERSGHVATAGEHAAEGSVAREAAERAVTPAHDESGETLFGINTESTTVIVAADFVAIALIGLVLFATGRALRPVGLAIAATSLGAVALDMREMLHQQDLGRTGLLILVVVVAAFHLAAGAAGLRLMGPRDVRLQEADDRESSPR